MTAEQRLQAASLAAATLLMRERAAIASPSPWVAISSDEPQVRYGLVGAQSARGTGKPIAVLADAGGHRHGDTLHIASWHPRVAIAVADLLDALADVDLPAAVLDRVLELASTYLAEPAPPASASDTARRPLPADPEPCESCGEQIVWAITLAGPNGPGGKRMPLDAHEDAAGNVAARPASRGRILARVLHRGETVSPPVEYRAMPHFATCHSRTHYHQEHP